MDGDTLLDGEDDQDNDDVTNIVELYEIEKDLDGNGQPAFCAWKTSTSRAAAWSRGSPGADWILPCSRVFFASTPQSC